MRPAVENLNEYEAWREQYDNGVPCTVVTIPIGKAHEMRAFVEKYSPQCPVCGGDCASANPPAMNCPKRGR
jgi:hypothetical protein